MLRRRPGEVADAIIKVLQRKPDGASTREIRADVVRQIGDVPASSVRSYLRLNLGKRFRRTGRARYALLGGK